MTCLGQRARHARLAVSRRHACRRETARRAFAKRVRARWLPEDRSPAASGPSERRLRRSPRSWDGLLHELADGVPGAVLLPDAQVLVDGLPRRQVARQRPPGAAVLAAIRNGVDD